MVRNQNPIAKGVFYGFCSAAVNTFTAVDDKRKSGSKRAEKIQKSY